VLSLVFEDCLQHCVFSSRVALRRRANEALERVKQQAAERTDEDHAAKNQLLALNKKAIHENRARAQSEQKRASGKGGGGYDPYSRKATKVVQYWTTKKKEEEAQAAAEREEGTQASQVWI
jgi:hypothetical protein